MPEKRLQLCVPSMTSRLAPNCLFLHFHVGSFCLRPRSPHTLPIACSRRRCRRRYFGPWSTPGRGWPRANGAPTTVMAFSPYRIGFVNMALVGFVNMALALIVDLLFAGQGPHQAPVGSGKGPVSACLYETCFRMNRKVERGNGSRFRALESQYFVSVPTYCEPSGRASDTEFRHAELQGRGFEVENEPRHRCRSPASRLPPRP